MAIQISGTTVIDNSRNLTNIESVSGNGIATQAEAEVGTNNDQIMTPLRVSQAIAAQGATISNDTSTNATRYPVFEDSTSGTVSTLYVSSSKLQYNPLSGTLFATAFTSLSDKTQKTNVRKIENALDMVKKIDGVRYDWKDDHNQSSIGVIAQEIEKVLPEVVTTNEKGLKTVSYGNIVALLIEAIKEQQVRIEELEEKINGGV